MTKAEYVQFCNQIHLLDLQASKGGMGKEEARRIRQTLLADLAGSGRKSATHERPKRRRRARTRRCQSAARRPSVPGPRPSRPPRPARRRQYDRRITPRRVRMRKHHNKWQRTGRKRWQQLLNNKRDPASVAEVEAELNPTTQRLIPTPRKRKGKRNLQVINLGT